MNEVLYADSNGKPSPVEYLVQTLKDARIEFDYIDREEHDVKALFWQSYYPKLHEYKVLVAHLGTSFNDKLFLTLQENPGLNIIQVTSVDDLMALNEEDYRLMRKKKISPDRILICDYKSKGIIPFIKSKLKK